MEKFSRKQLEELKQKGLIRGYTVNGEPEAKQSKYRNKKVEVDGMVFDSKKEAARYLELRMLQTAGEITELDCQVTYLLIEANETERKCMYKADFRYKQNGVVYVEDVKSIATRKLSTYIMKRKLMKEKYGIEIKEK
jgi:dsDNA-binding SOS-regulon protein